MSIHFSKLFRTSKNEFSTLMPNMKECLLGITFYRCVALLHLLSSEIAPESNLLLVLKSWVSHCQLSIKKNEVNSSV